MYFIIFVKSEGVSWKFSGRFSTTFAIEKTFLVDAFHEVLDVFREELWKGWVLENWDAFREVLIISNSILMRFENWTHLPVTNDFYCCWQSQETGISYQLLCLLYRQCDFKHHCDSKRHFECHQWISQGTMRDLKRHGDKGCHEWSWGT